MMRGKSVWLPLWLIAALIVGIHHFAFADPLGSISGSIVDGSGSGVSGATVSAYSKCGNHTTSSDAQGHFSFSGLAPCDYKIVANAASYTPSTGTVTLAAGATGAIALTIIKVASTADEKKPAEKLAPKQMNMPDQPAVTASPPPAHYHMAPSPAAGKPMPMALEQDPAMTTEAYARIDENTYQPVQTHPLSTFSADVDTASYSNTRRFLKQGQLPPPDAVRLEELINYFHYDLPPAPASQPFSITTEVGTSPFDTAYKIVRIGLMTSAIDDAKVPPRNLTFLIDVSGSMFEETKLPLLKRALLLLVEQLRPEDHVAMVVYAGNSGLVLPPTTGREKNVIRNAIQALEAGGSTNGAAGIEQAYETAQKNFAKGGINRVILCTDGDFNVGTTSEGDLTRLIEKKRESGVFLTVLGFGMGNIKDSTMEKLADRGNGNYAYIDSIEEARKVLVKEAGATLVTVAKDVKLQVEFNPTQVAGYRLIGYEKRILEDKDFNDDKKDAGDIGAGHAVTALYEIIPAGQPVPGSKVDALKYQKTSTTPSGDATELMTVKIRYKAPDGKTSKLLSQPVKTSQTTLAKTTVDFRWAVAVAGFGMMLRSSPNRGNLSWQEVLSLAEGSVGPDTEGYRAELVQLIKIAAKLKHS
jgi:Ca-activated chloride channel family protein